MTPAPANIAIQTGANDIRFASEWLGRFCAERDVPAEQVERLDICLNEVLANVASYGGASATDTPVLLAMAVTVKDEFAKATLTVSDSGQPFNPLTAVTKPQVQSLADAVPGGLGLTMIRCYSDSLDYVYLNGKNCLQIMVQWVRSAQ